MNAIDKIISILNPVAGAKRIMARSAIRQWESYEAASKGRRTSHWRRTNNDADADIVPNITWLRNTARNMVRNNPYAFSAIESLVVNCVATGIRPDLSGDDKTIEIISKYWKNWAETTECDFSGLMNFYGQQSLGARAKFESGAALLIRRRLKSSDKGVIPIKLQLLEVDYIDLNKNDYGTRARGGGYIRHGIEYNSTGQRVAYWLFPQHPGNDFGFFAQSERVPADDVIHLFRRLRPGQDHGVPVGVSSFLLLNDFMDYLDAERVGKKMQACFAVFITGGLTDLPTDDETKDDKPREKLAPGIIVRNRPGETVTMANPPPSSGTAEYARVNLLSAAAGYGTTYERMTGDLVNVNLSSIRVGDLEFQRRIDDIQQNTLIPQMCDKVFKWFLEALMLVETIDTSLISVSWTAPRRAMVDIDKETKALGNQILFGLNSWSEIAREGGNNPKDLAKQIAADQKMFKDMNIKLTSDASNITTAQPTDSNNDNKDENGDNTDGSTGSGKEIKPIKGKNPGKKNPVNKS